MVIGVATLLNTEVALKKLAVIGAVVVLCLSLSPVSSQAKSDRQAGGMTAFFIGCCWGLREGTEWNEGADMHWREWLSPVPGINIWNGLDCYKGIGAHDWAKQNGAAWY